MSESYHTPEKNQPHRRKKFPPAKPGCKYCHDCEQELLFERFPRSNTKDGYDSRCKECRADYHAQYRAKHYVPKESVQVKPGHKICTGCGEELLLEKFPIRGGKSFRLCRNCDRERALRYVPVEKPRLKASKEDHKICTICEKELPFEQFHLQKGKPMATCIDCTRSRDRARQAVHKPRKTPIKPKPTMENHKICNACLKEKPFGAFTKTKLFKDGLAGKCKQCQAEERANRTEEEKLQDKMRRQAYQENHLEEIRERDRQRFITSPSRRLAHEMHNRLRDERIRGVQVEEVDYQYILERDGYWCYVCSHPIDPEISKGPAMLTFDHIIPLLPRTGDPQGSHTKENLKPCHKICNQRKSNKRFESLTAFDRRGL